MEATLSNMTASTDWHIHHVTGTGYAYRSVNKSLDQGAIYHHRMEERSVGLRIAFAVEIGHHGSLSFIF